MPESEYLRSTRQTAAATKATLAISSYAAAIATKNLQQQATHNAVAEQQSEAQTAVLREQSRLLEAQSELLEEQAEAAWKQVELQALALNEQRGARDEQRAHFFAMWRQTADGAAYLEWQQDAHLLIGLIEERDKQWQANTTRRIATVKAQAQAARLALLPDATLGSTPSATKHSSRFETAELLSALAWIVGGSSVVLGVVWGITSLLWTFFGVSTFIAHIIWYPVGATIVFWIVGLAIRPRDEIRANKKAEESKKEAEAAGARFREGLQRDLRTRLITEHGYDPLVDGEAERYLSSSWMKDDAALQTVTLLKAYFERAYLEHPPLNSYPALTLPRVAAPSALRTDDEKQLALTFADENEVIVIGPYTTELE